MTCLWFWWACFKVCRNFHSKTGVHGRHVGRFQNKYIYIYVRSCQSSYNYYTQLKQCVFFRGYWKSFSNGLQRVIIFTSDEGVLERIRAENSYSVPLFEASLSLRSIGLSLVDNDKRRELAYIAITQ